MSITRNNVSPNTRYRLIAIAVAGACAAFTAPAFAQEAAAPAATTDVGQPSGVAAVNTVTVTGIRASMQSTLNLKRNSDGIVDGIVADDIGKFPDTNLAEAVQRISGVSIDRQNGEGSRVTVRGVGPDLNLVLLNGRQMPSANLFDRGSRSFDLANLASESVSQIQVYKSSRADNPTGGLGATLNIMTGRPLDLGNQTSIGGKIVFDKSNTNLPEQIGGKRFTPEVSTLISRKFGEGDMFGIGLTASYQSRNLGQNDARITDGWRGPFPATQRSGDGAIQQAAEKNTQNAPTTGIYNTPQNLSYFLNGAQRQRTNAQLTFQFRPIKDWTSTVDYTYARNKVQTRGTELNVWYNQNDKQFSSWKNGPVNAPLMYSEAEDHVDFSMNGHDAATKAELKSIGFNTQYRVNSGLKLSFDAHHSTMESGSDSPWGFENDLATAARGRNTNGIIFGADMPVFYQDNFDEKMPFQPTGSWFHDAKVKQVIDQFQASGSLKIGESSNLNFGASHTKSKLKSDYQQVMNGSTWNGVSGENQSDALKYFNQSWWTPIDYRGYFSQLSGSDNPRLYSKMWLVDFAKVRDAASKLPKDTPAGKQGNYYAARLDAPEESQNLQEKSTALYGQLNTEWDTALPIHTGIGLRYEKTKVTSTANNQPIVAVAWVSQNEYNYTRGDARPLVETHDYHYWLPTVDFDIDVLSNLKVRASYTTNIGRPRWDQIQGGSNPQGNPTVSGQTIKVGNPALNPVKTNNLDLSAEWYYTKQSMVSLGLFHKKLAGYAGSTVVNTTDPTVTTPVNGAYYKAALAPVASGGGGCSATDTYCQRDFIFTKFRGSPGVQSLGMSDGHYDGKIFGQPGDPALPLTVNSIANQKNATLKGAEINLQHMFDNGFGIQGNYTYVKSDLAYNNALIGDQFALVGMSNSANLVGIYEDKTWSVRLAYNWRGQFLNTTNANGKANPEYVEPYGQVDLSVGYNVNQNLTLSLEAINLTNSTIRTHGRDELMVLRASQGGPRYMLGARYKF